MLVLVAALLLAGAASGVLRSHALFHSGQSGMPSIQDMQAGATDKLPEAEIQDRSVVFAKEPAH
jgi:hypothetical protein